MVITKGVEGTKQYQKGTPQIMKPMKLKLCDIGTYVDQIAIKHRNPPRFDTFQHPTKDFRKTAIRRTRFPEAILSDKSQLL